MFRIKISFSLVNILIGVFTVSNFVYAVPQFSPEKPAVYPFPFNWSSYHRLDVVPFITVNPGSPDMQYTFSINKDEYCEVDAMLWNVQCLGAPLYGTPTEIYGVGVQGYCESYHRIAGFFGKYHGLVIPPPITASDSPHSDVNYYFQLPPKSYLDFGQVGFTAARDDHNQLIVITTRDKTDPGYVIFGKYRGFVLSPKGSYLIVK